MGFTMIINLDKLKQKNLKNLIKNDTNSKSEKTHVKPAGVLGVGTRITERLGYPL